MAIRFILEGARKDTGAEQQLVVEANDAAQAEQIANVRGLFVSIVRPVEPPIPPVSPISQKTVPPFNTYYPSLESAGAEQCAFYRWLVGEFGEGRFPDVQGNLSYLFVFIYETVHNFIKTRDYSTLESSFRFLRSGYAGTPNVSRYLDTWQGDAALLVQCWADAWEYKRRGRLDIDLVVNVRKRCSTSFLEAQDMHALLLSDNGLTECGRRRLDAVNAEANRLLSQFHESNGMNLVDAFVEKYAWRELKDSELEEIEDDCGYLVSARKLKNAYHGKTSHEQIERPLFSGVLMPWETEHGPTESLGGGMTMSFSTRLRAQNPTAPMMHVSRAIELAVTAQCMRLLREAENNVREREGLPRIGEGWVSETELFNVLRGAFPDVKVAQHARPEWLSPQHLDVYLPEFGIGIEFQGAQHLEPVDYFGGEKAFAQQQRRDARKRRLCRQNRCLLVEVFQGYDGKLLVAKIRGLMPGGTVLHCRRGAGDDKPDGLAT